MSTGSEGPSFISLVWLLKMFDVPKLLLLPVPPVIQTSFMLIKIKIDYKFVDLFKLQELTTFHTLRAVTIAAFSFRQRDSIEIVKSL